MAMATEMPPRRAINQIHPFNVLQGNWHDRTGIIYMHANHAAQSGGTKIGNENVGQHKQGHAYFVMALTNVCAWAPIPYNMCTALYMPCWRSLRWGMSGLTPSDPFG
eukprot:360210-Chlamydomonas_euryale.AAC.4